MKAGKAVGGGEAPRIELTLDTAQILLVVAALAGLCWASFLVGQWVERDRWRDLAAKSEARPGKPLDADPGGDLTFFDTLGSKSAEPERQAVHAQTTPLSAPPESPPGDTADGPVQSGPAAQTKTPVAPTTGGSNTSAGYAVQVFAGDRTQAEKLAATLTRKGYTAKLIAGTSGPRSARVRVYGFHTRTDADRSAERLKREEKLRPWVVKPD